MTGILCSKKNLATETLNVIFLLFYVFNLRGRQSFHVLIHLPNAGNSQDWASVKVRMQDCNPGLSYKGTGAQLISHPTASRAVYQLKAEVKSRVVNLTWYPHLKQVHLLLAMVCCL